MSSDQPSRFRPEGDVGRVPGVNMQKPVSAPPAVNLSKSSHPEPIVDMRKGASAGFPGPPSTSVPAPAATQRYEHQSPYIPYTALRTDTAQQKPRWVPVLIGAVVVAMVGVIALLAHNLASDDESPTTADAGRGESGQSSGGTAADARPCADDPRLQAQSVDMTPAGLAVTTDVSAVCSSGDVVSSSAVQVMVTDGGRDVASGVFDLAADPMVVPAGETVRHEFVFPAGMYWRPPELLSNDLSVTVANSGGSSSRTAPMTDGATTAVAVAAGTPTSGSAEDAALTGLRELAARDQSTVRSSLENRWVPQISSKRQGLVAEGIVWDNSEILREHLSLRQQYPDVRLVWSGDWNTFSGPDWWVTVVGAAFSDAAPALGWCETHGLDADHCYAKIISSTRGVDGTTMLQK